MTKELEQKLLEKYPFILQDMYGPVDKTAMHWGITCGDGWYRILDTLLYSIDSHEKSNRSVGQVINPVIALQIKEKFAGLRFYYTGGDNFIHGMVQLAEEMSYKVCEECGNMDAIKIAGNRWHRSLCPECKEKHEQ